MVGFAIYQRGKMIQAREEALRESLGVVGTSKALN
jgi:hypothetical protein